MSGSKLAEDFSTIPWFLDALDVDPALGEDSALLESQDPLFLIPLPVGVAGRSGIVILADQNQYPTSGDGDLSRVGEVGVPPCPFNASRRRQL